MGRDTSRPRWTLRLSYDDADEVVTLEHPPTVVLATAQDVAEYFALCDVEIAKFKGPFDLLIDYTDFFVKSAMARVYGEHRRSVLERHTRRSYRYGGEAETRSAVYTSSVLQGMNANVYRSRDEALAALIADRGRSAKGL